MLRLVNSSLCYLSVVYRNIRLEKRVTQRVRQRTFVKESSVCSRPVSLLESEVVDHSVPKPGIFADQLHDLISFDEGMDTQKANQSSGQKSDNHDPSEGGYCKVDDMITANLLDFGNQSERQDLRRRPMRVPGM